MFGQKKNKSVETKWIVTFADLITLLFCFFVYLSLFNKPQVDLKTGFTVDEETTKSLTGRLPDEVVSALDSMKGEFFEIREPFEARLENLIGQNNTSLYKTPILIESVAEGKVDESAGCLLYTSPSPRDATLSRMPSSA